MIQGEKMATDPNVTTVLTGLSSAQSISDTQAGLSNKNELNNIISYINNQAASLTTNALVLGGPVTSSATAIPAGNVTSGAVGQIGTGGATAVSGDDNSGTVTVTSGTGTITAGLLVTVAFNTAGTAAPKYVGLTPANAAASAVQIYSSSSSTGFSINGNTALPVSTTFQWKYVIVR